MAIPNSPAPSWPQAGTHPSSGTDEPEEETSAVLLAFAKRRPYLMWALTGITFVILALLVLSVARNPRVGWGVIGHYLFESHILHGVLVTLELTGICLVLGLAIGLVIAIMLTASSPFLRWVGLLYAWVFRSVPPLVQLIIWAFLAALYPTLSLGIPDTGLQIGHLSTKSTITPFIAAIVAFSLIEGAYAGETIRAGFAGVGKGQIEAATVLGLSGRQRLFRVVLPQAMPMILPPMGNNLTNLLKGTSIVAVIGGAELMTQAQAIYAENYQVIPLLFVAALWYLVLTGVLSIGQRFLERHYSRSSRPRITSMKAVAQP